MGPRSLVLNSLHLALLLGGFFPILMIDLLKASQKFPFSRKFLFLFVKTKHISTYGNASTTNESSGIEQNLASLKHNVSRVFRRDFRLSLRCLEDAQNPDRKNGKGSPFKGIHHNIPSMEPSSPGNRRFLRGKKKQTPRKLHKNGMDFFTKGRHCPKAVRPHQSQDRPPWVLAFRGRGGENRFDQPPAGTSPTGQG